MRTKLLTSFLAGMFLLVVLMSGVSAATVTLSDYVLNPDGVASNVHASVGSAGDFVAGSAVTSFSFGASGATGSPWSTSASPGTDNYYQLSLSPQSGYSLDITAINFGERRSNDGPQNYQVQWSKSPSFTSPTTIATVNIGDALDTVERDGSITGLNINVANGETIYIRWFGYGAESAAGTWRINDNTLNIVGNYDNSLSVSSSTMSQSSNSTTVVVTNDGNTLLSSVALTATGGFNVTLNPTTIASFAAGANQTVTVTRDSTISLNIGTNTATINALSGTTSATGIVTIEKSFCSSGPVNDTKLDFNVDIKNNGQGDDDNWLPLDEIEVEVELKNDLGQDADGDDIDLSDITFVLGLIKKGTSSDVAADMIWLSDDEEEFEFGDINEGDDGKHVFSFRVDPAEIDGGDYYLVVKAFPSGDEDLYCVDYSSDLTSFGSKNYYAEIKIDEESDKDKMVVIDETSFPVITEATCNEQVSLIADVWNIGNFDFEDSFMVTLFNKDLGIDLKAEVPEDLDAGDNAEVSFVFTIPADAEEKTYTLAMRTYYDYDAGDGTYFEDYDKISDDTFNALLKVAGNCAVSQPASVDSTTVESGGKAGQDLVIKTTVKNTGTKTATYVVNPAGYNEWASSAKVDTQSFSLGAGESKEVSITLDVKRGVSGDKTFDLEISSGNKLVSTQPVAVTIEPGFSLAGITGNVISGNNGYLWGFVALNVVLIGAIIFVIVRFLRK